MYVFLSDCEQKREYGMLRTDGRGIEIVTRPAYPQQTRTFILTAGV